MALHKSYSYGAKFKEPMNRSLHTVEELRQIRSPFVPNKPRQFTHRPNNMNLGLVCEGVVVKQEVNDPDFPNDNMDSLRLRVASLEQREMQIVDLVKQLESHRVQLEADGMLLIRKDKELKDKENELESTEKSIRDEKIELYTYGNQMREYENQIREYEKEYNARIVELLEREKKVNLKEMEMESLKSLSEDFLEREKKINSKESEIQSLKSLYEERLRDLGEKDSLIDSIQKLIEESKAKGQINERPLPKSKEKQLGENSVNVSGQKRTIPCPSANKNKRVATAKKVDEPFKKCEEILKMLMRRKHAWIFNKPVDQIALEAPDYHKIIKHPMDLGTVKSKLLNHEYGSPQEFASDVRLTFTNALEYNPEGHEVYKMATVFRKSFEVKFKLAYPEYGVCKLENLDE